MSDMLITVISGLIFTAVVLAILVTFFLAAFKIIKVLPKAEKALDIYIEKNKQPTEFIEQNNTNGD